MEIETGKASMAQVGKVDVTIRAWDQWGNAVTDGTSLEVSIEGDARIYPDVAFTDGVAEAVVEGGLEPGEANLIVKVGTSSTRKDRDDTERPGQPQKIDLT